MPARNWGLTVEDYNDNELANQFLPVDDDDLHWELAHELHDTATLADANDYTSAFCSVLHSKEWTHSAAIGDAATVMRPYIRMVDELFDLEDIEYTDNVQARYFDQLSWMFLHTYARIHKSYTTESKTDV